MAREVNDTQPYQDKLVKLIPTEIVGAYMVLAGMLGFDPTSTAAATVVQATGAAANAVQVAGQIPISELKPVLIQIVFVLLLILTPIYLWKVSRVSNVVQIVVTTFSYVIWVYTLGGPFVVWGLYYPLIGSVILVIWSLITPLFVSASQP